MTIYSVGTASGYDSTVTVNGVIYKVATPRNSGTGGYNTFLAIQDNDGTEQGFNTDGTPTTENQIGDSKTFAIKLGNMPITTIDGVQYFEIRLDLNESNGGTSPYVDLNSLKIYTGGYLSSTGTIVDTISELESMTLRYDLDAGGDNQIHMYDGSSGSGTDDYVILVPVSSFAGANFATDYFYLEAQFGTVPGQFDAEGGFEEFNLQTAVILHGTKFNDVNSNGANDDNADTPTTVGGITINLYEDTDKSGTLNAGDVVLQTTTTDSNGNYYFYGVKPGATYFIDEANSSSYNQTTGSYETVVVSSTAAVGSTVEVDPIGNHYPVPHLYIDKTAAVAGGSADTVGELVTYTVKVSGDDFGGPLPASELPLTNIVVTDEYEGGAPVTLQYADGTLGAGVTVNKTGGDTDNILEAGELWTYTYTRTVSQTELNSNGDGAAVGDNGDGKLSNTATADSAETTPVSDSAEVPIVQAPSLNIVKDVSSITGGELDGLVMKANSAGDVINYAISVDNTGNIDLTGVSVSDPNADANSITYVSGDDGDGVLETNETWHYTATHTVTQGELNSRGNDSADGADGDVDNVATADSDQTGPDTDPASAPLLYQPLIDIEKYVSVTGINGTYADADGPAGLETSVNAPVFFKITLANTGNITLSGITISDVLQNYDAGGNPTTTSPIDIAAAGFHLYYDTDGDGNLDAGETTLVTTLAPGQKAVGIYEQPFVGGQHTNTATVNTTQGATDFDAANYFGIINEGPGVRTPGFWQNLNNGATFWDGDPNNQAHNGPTFPGFNPATGTNSDILYTTDFGKGLLVGDYDRDGTIDTGADGIAGTGDAGEEDGIFIPYDLALKLVGNDTKSGNDGAFMLGRDVVASWLNFLAGNNIGDDSGSPRHYIDDAVDWLQEFASNENNDTASSATMQLGGAIKSSSAFWKSASGNNVQGHTWDTHHSGAAIHGALDEYNNFGTVNDVFYAGDGDSSTFAFALTQATTMGLFSESLYGLDQDGSLLTNATLIAL